VANACQHRVKARADVDVVVKAEHRVGLRQRIGELGAVPLGETADRDDCSRSPRTLEVRGGEDGVYGVLLCRLDEAARVDEDDVGLAGLGHELEPARVQPAGELFRVDLVAGTAQRDDSDAAGPAADRRH
jgi:hypothetical protein